MGTTRKAFMYIVNTTTEVRKVAKVLSDHEPESTHRTRKLDLIGHKMRVMMASVRDEPFVSSTNLSDPRLRASDAAADVLFAHLAAAYPRLKALRAYSPLVVGVERALELCISEADELLGWSRGLHAARDAADCVAEAAPHPKHIGMLQRQAATIDEDVALNANLFKRVFLVEKALAAWTDGGEQESVGQSKPPARPEE